MSGIQKHYPDCPQGLLVSLARTGDKAALDDLIRRKQSHVRNLLRRFCGNTAEADDLAQQVFVQVWRSLGKLKNAAAFDAWLKRITVTVWLQHIRKNHPEYNDHDDETGVKETPAIAMDLNRALSMLKPEVRTCVVLAYHEGMTHAEISEQVDLPLGTVKSHINRGTQRLKQLLGDYDAANENNENV